MKTKTLVKKEFTHEDYVKATLEVDSMLVVKATTESKVDIVAELEKLAKLTDTQLDDNIVKGLKQFLAAANAALALAE